MTYTQRVVLESETIPRHPICFLDLLLRHRKKLLFRCCHEPHQIARQALVQIALLIDEEERRIREAEHVC